MFTILDIDMYEEAKSRFRDNGSLHAEQMKNALLNFRRENNIYEVGDQVIHDDRLEIFIVQEVCGTDIRIDPYLFHENKYFRHATPEEIKVGHRLEDSSIDFSSYYDDCNKVLDRMKQAILSEKGIHLSSGEMQLIATISIGQTILANND